MSMFACATQKKETAAEPEVAATTACTTDSDGITGKRWILIEINGQPVTPTTEIVNGMEIKNAQAFMMLDATGGRVSASGGCNTMGGTFELQSAAMRIRFSQMFSTQMACINKNYDVELGQVLEMVDNYSLSADGKTLLLNRARMAPLASFVSE